jgi:hypothetical protein
LLLGEIRNDLGALREELHLDQEALRAEVARWSDSVNELAAAINEFVAAGPGQPPGAAYRMATQHAELEEDTADAEDKIRGRAKSWLDKITEALLRVGKYLWRMISRLVTVKEWSLTGEINTGVLGLGKASISVTFGK